MSNVTQPSSLGTSDYEIGRLSNFPSMLDTERDLYVAGNRVTTTLLASLSPVTDVIFINDDVGFPSSGIIKIDREYIFYSAVSDRLMTGLIRGFAGSDASEHQRGSSVDLVIMADHHNALRDAVYQLEHKVGLTSATAVKEGNLSERVAYLRAKWYTPRALWFTRPQKGAVPLEVQFINFSRGFPNAFHWNFGDGTTLSGSDEAARHPIHVYREPGYFNVSLTIFTPRRGSSQSYKIGQVVAQRESEFVQPIIWSEIYSESQGGFIQGSKGRAPIRVRFTDQTDGKIQQRIWSFGDGETAIANGPYDISVEHYYNDPGQYQPSLFLRLDDDRTINVRLPYLVEALD